MDNKKILAIGGLSVVALGIGLLLTKKTKAEPGMASLSGIVIDDESGYPIGGVIVSLDSMKTSTNSSGQYSFSNVEPGDYPLMFEKVGYETLVL